MGIEERKAREKQKRRNDILEAAENVIFSKGLDQATMDEIADEAELSKGTLYLYFKNKNDLYLAICERGSAMLNQRLSKVITRDEPGIELIRHLGEAYIDFVKTYPNYFNAFLYYESYENVQELEDSKSAQVCEDNVREAMTYIVRALQIGMQDGSIDSSYNPRELAVQIWGSTRGLIQLSHMKQSGHYTSLFDEMNVDVKDTFEGFIDLVLRGIQAESYEMKSN